MPGGIAAADLTTVIFCVFGLAWLILPIVVFGLDSTLDPATLALYPLRTRPLAVGLLAASATGAWPAATLIGLLGVTIGLARGALGVLIALLAVVLQVLFCITLARFVTTGLAGVLRSRRGKDFAALLFIPIFAVYEGFFQIVPKLTSEGALTASSFGGVDTWLRWTPPGLAVHAIFDASAGHPGTALLRLALLAGIIVVLGVLWIQSLRRALVTTDTSTQSAVRGSALPFARYGLRGTVAARFWLYQRREPFSLIYWAITAVIMAVVAFRLVLSPDWFGGLLASGAAGGAFVGAFHSNAIGMSGPGFGLEAIGAERPARAARLLLRAEHRARHDRGAAGHGGLFRPGGRGQASDGRVRGHGGGPGRDRRGPGPGQPLHRHVGLPGGKARRHPHAQGDQRT